MSWSLNENQYPGNRMTLLYQVYIEKRRWVFDTKIYSSAYFCLNPIQNTHKLGSK